MLSSWTDAIYELMFKIVTRMLLRSISACKKRTSLVFDLQVAEVGSPLTFYLPLLCPLFLLLYLHVLFTFHVVLFVFFNCSNKRELWPWSNAITIARRRPLDCKSRWDLPVDKGHSMAFPLYWSWSWMKDWRINIVFLIFQGLS